MTDMTTMPAMPAMREHRRRARVQMGIALVSIVLWQTTIGSLVLYPFTILATWFHEMGHGIAAMMTGATFDRLVIYANGSGVALSLRAGEPYRITSALVAASGPMGPAIAGSMLILASRTPSSSRTALKTLGWALVLSTLIWVRSPTGWIVLPGLGMGILAVARYGSPSVQRFVIQLLGVQACIGVWRQLGYLFTAGGAVGGQMHRSDTGAMEDALLLPYWVWGGAIGATIMTMLWWSLRKSFRS